MEEGASPPRWALDKKLGEDASMEDKKERREKRFFSEGWCVEVFYFVATYASLFKES